jgi:hypothetical protein
MFNLAPARDIFRLPAFIKHLYFYLIAIAHDIAFNTELLHFMLKKMIICRGDFFHKVGRYGTE